MPEPINLEFVLPYYAAAMVIGYLCGSVPFGLILTRMAGLGDIRKIGSGNIGATNVLRTGKTGLAVLTLLLDALKGFVPVLIARLYYGPDITVLVGLAAFLGHLFPVWLKFRGGKGVAVACGILAGFNWLVALGCIGVWIATAAITRLSSLAALFTAAFAPLLFWFAAAYQYAETASLMALLVWFSHRQNIARLWRGLEPRIGEKKT